MLFRSSAVAPTPADQAAIVEDGAGGVLPGRDLYGRPSAREVDEFQVVPHLPGLVADGIGVADAQLPVGIRPPAGHLPIRP